MHDPIEKLVSGWGSNELTAINKRLISLERWLFKSYEPDKFHNGDFWLRLEKYLENVDADAEKRLLFQLVVELFYVGPVEFEELYRCAYQGPIARWLMDRCNIDAFASSAKTQLQQAAKDTWFCPVTDSFRINAFFHVNNLAASANLRPDWHSLLKLGNTGKLNKYCKKNRIKRLVLLEDFVGGGDQSLAAVRYAATLAHGLEVLFLPLIICPAGVKNAQKLEAELCGLRINSLRFESVLKIPEDAFLTATLSPYAEPNSEVDKLRKLIESTYAKVSGGNPLGYKPYDPYGYPPKNPTGGLVVMFSNTPDNTLPLVHWCPPSNTWSPIFPRHSRV